NLSVAFPILKVLFREKSLHAWTGETVARHAAELKELELSRSNLEEASHRLRARSPSQDVEDELAETHTQLKRAARELAHARSRHKWYVRVHHAIEQYIPEDMGWSLVSVMSLLMLVMASKGVLLFFNESLAGQVTLLSMFDLKNRLYRHSMNMDL